MTERYRVEPTGRGFWPFCVVAGDGTLELFIGHRKSCEQVAAELTTAFMDGEFVGKRDYDALHAEAEALRAENERLSQQIAQSDAALRESRANDMANVRTLEGMWERHDALRQELDAARELLAQIAKQQAKGKGGKHE